ncbi:agouti-related protein isoform X1 [Erythrolamprus reginae]|uniref:agouti-related protein isoform X1 n=1 Tax=Erythrolamprus reginae TaxID=121349 RepID=UPI00396CA554
MAARGRRQPRQLSLSGGANGFPSAELRGLVYRLELSQQAKQAQASRSQTAGPAVLISSHLRPLPRQRLRAAFLNLEGLEIRSGGFNSRNPPAKRPRVEGPRLGSPGTGVVGFSRRARSTPSLPTVWRPRARKGGRAAFRATSASLAAPSPLRPLFWGGGGDVHSPQPPPTAGAPRVDEAQLQRRAPPPPGLKAPRGPLRHPAPGEAWARGQAAFSRKGPAAPISALISGRGGGGEQALPRIAPPARLPSSDRGALAVPRWALLAGCRCGAFAELPARPCRAYSPASSGPSLRFRSIPGRPGVPSTTGRLPWLCRSAFPSSGEEPASAQCHILISFTFWASSFV